ncbi:MAG: hypothetical protein ACI8WT_000129 [Clostridium sp.]|jgi:hypothetical protein
MLIFTILFLYPINRKKIMLAKLAIVAMVLSSIFLNFSLYILNIFVNFIPVPLTGDVLIKNLINIVVFSSLGAATAYLAIKDVEKVDLVN